MDYFKFDLQLFAAAITLTFDETASAAMTTTEQYLVGETWKTAEQLANNDVITAELKSGVLTVAATAEGANITVTGPTAAQMQGVTLKVVQGMTFSKPSEEPGEVVTTNPEGAAVTGTFTLSMIDEGLTVAVQSAKTEDPATAATTAKVNSDGNLEIVDGVIVTANTIAYTAKADSVLAINVDGPATIVSGSVQLAENGTFKVGTGSFKSTVADKTVTVADGLLSFDKGATIAALDGEGNPFVTVANTSENAEHLVTMNASGAVTTLAASAKCSVTIAAVDGTATIGDTTYTAKTAGTTIAYDGTAATLSAGSVSMSTAGAKIADSNNVEFVNKKASKAITVHVTNGLTAMDEGAKVEATAASGKTVKIGTVTYITQADGTKFEATALTAVTLTAGSTKVPNGAAITAGDNVISNTSAESSTITVDKDGNVTAIGENGIASVQIPATGATTIGNVTYTNAGEAPVTIQGTGLTAASLTSDAGVVTLQGSGAPAVFTAGDYTYTHTTDEDKTVTVSKTGVVSEIEEDATVVVQVSEAGKTVTFGTVAYTSATAADFMATALDAVTLTSGSVELDKGEAITAGANVITNAATEESSNLLTVDFNGNVTNIEEKAIAQVAIAKAHASIIGGVVYTNAGESAATIVATASGATLSGEGTVTLNGKGAENKTLAIGKDYTVTYTTSDDNTVTISNAGVVSAITGTAAVAVQAASGKTITIGDVVYTNEGEGAAEISATASGSKLTEGTVSFDKLNGAIVWGDQGVTITNNVADKATIVNTTNGVTGVAEGGLCTVNLGNAENNAIKINSVEYKSAAAEAATLEVTKSGDALAAEVKSGSVTVPAGQDITANGTVITSGLEGDALITVASTGAVSGIETAGSKITVKKAGATATSTYEVKATGDNSTRDIYVTGAVIGVYDEVTVAGMTVTFTNGAAAVAVSGTPKAAASVEVTYDGENKYNFYALKDAGGTLTAVGAATAEEAADVEDAIGYFQFANTEGAETVTFHDLNGNAALTLGAVTINVGALTDITAINVTGVSAVENGVTLSNLSATVQEDAIAGTTNYSYAPINVLADPATIALGTEAGTAYYKLTTPTIDHGKTIYDIVETTNESEIAAGNVFKVETAINPKNTVTVTYIPAESGAINFNADHSTLTVNAAAAAEDAQITLSGTTVKNAVQKAKGSVTVVDTAERTTVSYFTTFAWAVGTYLIPVDAGKTVATGVESGDTVATGKYNKITVTEDTAGKFTIAITGVMGDMTPTTTTDITKVTATASVTELDATAIGVTGATIDGLQSGATVTLAEGDAATILSGTTALTVKKGEATPITYEATGPLTVRADGKATTGAFSLSTASGKISSLTGTKTFTTGDVATATVEWTAKTGTAAATVTFEEGAVATITGLDEVGEKVTVTKYEGTPATEKVYTYEVDSAASASTIVWKRTVSGEVSYVGGKTASDDVLGSNTWTAPAMVDEKFGWEIGSFCFSLTNGVKTTDGTKPLEVETGTTYIKATVAAHGVLTLAAQIGNALHQLEDSDGAGKDFKVDAKDAGAINYTRSGLAATAKVFLTNVEAGSTIFGLGTSDTIATAELAKGEKVTVGGVDYVEAAKDGGALAFKGVKLADGTVVAAGSELALFDGSTVITKGEAALTVADGAVATITGLDKGETLTVTKPDGDPETDDPTTTYTAHTDTIIWKTVANDPTPANDGTWVTKLDNAGDDVVAGSKGDYKYVKATPHPQNFAWKTSTEGNFIVASNAVALADYSGTIDYNNEGQKYVHLAVAGDGTLTLTEGTVDWKGDLQAKTEAIKGATYDIAVTIPSGAENSKVIKLSRYDSEGKALFDTTGKVTVTGAIAGSEIDLSGAKDTVATASLADGATIKIGGVTYTNKEDSSALKFTANQLTDGTVALAGTAEAEKSITIHGGTVVTISKSGSATLAVGTNGSTGLTSIESIKGIDAEGETVTVTEGDKVTTFVYEKAGYATKTVTIKGKEVSSGTVKMTDGDVWGANEVTSAYDQKFAWPADGKSVTFYTPVVEGKYTIKANTADAPELQKGDIVLMGTATKAEGKPVELTLTPMQYNGTTLVAYTSSVNPITIDPEGTVITYKDTTGAAVTVTNAAAGSVFENLAVGSTVTTANTLVKDQAITVNGQTYTAWTDPEDAGAKTQIVAFATKDSANIVSGAVTVTDKITSSTNAGGNVQSLAFKGTGKDGVQVVYADGAISSIKDLEVDEKVTLEVASTGDVVAYSYDGTKYERITMTKAAGTKLTETIVPTDGDVTHPTGVPDPTKMEVNAGLVWTDDETAICYVEKGETETTIGTTENWVSVYADETTPRIFVKAAVDEGTLTLSQVKSGSKTGEPTTDLGAFGGGKVIINDLGGNTITFEDKNGLASVELNNVGALSEITAWEEGDKVTMAAQEAYTTIAVGGQTFEVIPNGADLEVVNEGTGATHAVKSGTVMLASGGMTSLVATSKNGDVVTTYTVKCTAGSDVNVTVAGGIVTGITDLAYNETVTVTKQVGMDPEVVTTYTSTYTSSGFLVTKSQVVSGDYRNEWTYTFDDESKNILGVADDKWTVANIVTKQDFNWNTTETTGYFDSSVRVQDPAAYIDGKHGNKGKTLIKAVATTTAAGVATISELGFVTVQANGSFTDAPVPSGKTVTIDATGLTGLRLPTHTVPIAIVNAAPGTGENVNDFFGLNDGDTLSGLTAGNFTLTRIVKDSKGKEKEETSKFTVAEASEFIVTGAATITKGAFTVTDTATGSAILDAESEPAAKEITFTGEGKDGVKAAFANGAVATVKDLEDGENVVINSYQYDAKKKKETVYETTEIKKVGSKVTKTITNESRWGNFQVVMESTTATDLTDVFGMATFQMASKFDFTPEGTTSAIGLFDITAGAASIVGTQSEVPDAFGGDTDKSYVLVSATKTTKSKVNTYTVDHFEVLTYNHTKNQLVLAADPDTLLENGVTIASPADGGLALSAAVSAIERTYAITVTGATSGNAYTGFAAQDTISGTLKGKETITVNGKTFTSATTNEGGDAVTISGEGKAKSGTFQVGKGFETIGTLGKTAAKVSGLATAVAVVSDGVVTNLKGLTAGKTVTVVSTAANGAVTTDVYKAAKGSDSDHLTITRTRTADGVKSEMTATVAIGSDKTSGEVISGVTYGGEANGSVSSNFDWTVANGSGYFKTAITTEKPNNLGDLTVKPAATKITKSNKGETYLKVTLTSDGVVKDMTLQQVKADGTLETVAWGSQTGTLQITAPTARRLVFDRTTSTLPTNVHVTVIDAIDESEITKLQNGDVVTTSKLGAGDSIDVSIGEGARVEYLSAEADIFRLEVDGGVAKLSDGTLQFQGDETVTTTKGSYEVHHVLDQVAIVKVLNGEVVAVSGLAQVVAPPEDGYVQVTEGTVVAKYTMAGVTFTGLADGIVKTATLEAGKTVTIDTKTYTLGEGGAMRFFVDTSKGESLKAKVVEGTLALVADKSVALTTGDGKTDTTVATVAGNTNTAIVSVVNGVVTSITGLAVNDSVTVTKAGVVTTYTRTGTNTYSKQVGTADAVTAFMPDATGNIVDAKYLEQGASVDTTDETYAGQFSWVDIDGRSTGYFALNTKNQATIAEQTAKVVIGDSLKKAKANATQIYAVADTLYDAVNHKQTLTVSGAVEAKKNADGTIAISEVDAATLLNGKTLTVTAPTVAVDGTVPALIYTKAATDKFNIALNNVAANSDIRGLVGGDSIKTATLDPSSNTTNKVKVDGKTYLAGAKGALEFLGEGEVAKATNRTTLKKGTIVLNGTHTTANLSGETVKKVVGAGEDVTVTVSAVRKSDGTATLVPHDVTVTVSDGLVTGITGLYYDVWTDDALTSVTIEQKGQATVTYKVLYSEFVSRNAKTGVETYNTMVERTEGTGKSAVTTYALFTNLKSVYAKTATANGYKAAGADTPTYTDKLFAETPVNAKKQAQPVYVETDYNAWTKTATMDGSAAQTLKQTAAGGTIEAATAERGKAYIAATVKTDAKTGVTTISALKVAQINAQGVPTIVSGATVARAEIDCALIEGGNAKINYTIPKATTVNITNAAVGSVFTGVKDDDLIKSADATNYKLSSGTLTLYYNTGVGTQQTRKVTYTTVKGDDTMATIDVSDGSVEGLRGLDKVGEKVTLVTQTAAGEETVEYAVSKVNSVPTMTKTVTHADGKKEVYTAKLSDVTAETYDWLQGDSIFASDNPKDRSVVSDFNWTMDKKPVGYFVVDEGKKKATVAVQKSASNIKPNTNKYLAVTINGDGKLAANGIRQVEFDTDEGSATFNTLVDAETKFEGTIDVTAPTGVALTFDRDNIDANTIADKATVNITNAAADSDISNLKKGDKVTTAKLKYDAKNIIAESVTVGGVVYTVGAAGALTFLVQDVDRDEEVEDVQVTVIGGTIALASWGGMASVSAYIDTKRVTATDGDFNVTVSKNGAAYTVSGIHEGEKFTIEGDFEVGTGNAKTVKHMVKHYEVSATAIFCTTEVDGQQVTSVHSVSLGTKGASLASSVLETSEQNGKNGWTVYTDENKTFTEDAGGNLKLVNSKAAVKVDLATLDKRNASDVGPGTNNYQFVIDKYMAKPKDFKGAASVINENNLLDVQQVIGSATDNYIYKADYDSNDDPTGKHIAQTITAADKWTVYGSTLGDIINGASKGSDVLNGGQGNDTLTGGGANDTFTFADGDGNDVVKSYTSYVESTGKGDKLEIAYFTALDEDHVDLAGTGLDTNGKALKGVKLHDADDSVLLVGVAGKAVNIDGTTYYFGDGTKTKGSATFTYVEGARYYGNAALTNTLKVTTDKTKATSTTLGNTVAIDLQADAADYVNIDAIDASASANRLVLAAGDNGSTLKGGSYQSTLKAGSGKDSLVGGSGADVFWFDNVEKADAVSGYASGKDSFYFGNATGSTAAEINGMKIAASGNDVVITNSDAGSVTIQKAVNAAKAVTVLEDETGATKLSYYVGKAGTAAKLASNTFTATIGKEAVLDDTEYKNLSLQKNYYVGNDTATDTLAIKGTDTKTGNVYNPVTAKVSLADLADNLSSIDVLDASGLTKAANSKIKLESKLTGDSTLKGSTLNTLKETFIVQSDGKTTVQNLTKGKTLDVDDVIELGVGITFADTGTNEMNGTKYTGNSIFTLSNGGTLKVLGAKVEQLTAVTVGGSEQIKRK